MARQPEDTTLRILQQIQETLADHSRRFDNMQEQMDRRFERIQTQMDHRFDEVDRRLTELVDGTIKALGTSSLPIVRHDGVQNQFAGMELELRDLKARLKKLEAE